MFKLFVLIKIIEWILILYKRGKTSKYHFALETPILMRITFWYKNIEMINQNVIYITGFYDIV